jgi:N-acetylmuramoyl-L-alanine amidase
MKSLCASTTRRRSTARACISRVAVLTMIALGLVLASGCVESASPPPNLSATPALSTETTAVTRAGSSSSRHIRVMTEQGRLTGAATADGSNTTTSAGPARSITTTTGVPSVQSDSSTTVILTQGLTPLRGVWRGTAERLATFLVGVSPSPRFTVPASVLAEYYVRYCAEAGLRADLLWAQMIHETGYGMYGGDVLPEQNNYTGIGATGGDEPGASFLTAEAGVMAHVAHMVAYVYASTPVSWADASTDPRFDLVIPRGAASTLADLNGRWAVPGTTYGESIEAIARTINAG